jgi:hypothetical protein
VRGKGASDLAKQLNTRVKTVSKSVGTLVSITHAIVEEKPSVKVETSSVQAAPPPGASP